MVLCFVLGAAAMPTAGAVDGQVRERVAAFLVSALRGANSERYQQCVAAFRSDLASQGLDYWALGEEQLDYALADHVIDLYERHRDSTGLAEAGLLIAACSKVRPSHRYKTAWRVLDVWRVRCPAKQAPTFPPEVALGCTTWLLWSGRPQAAMATLLCFAGLLRISEALALTWDALVFGSREVTLLLGRTKRGMEQKVVLRHPRVVPWVHQYARRHMPSGRGEQKIFDLSCNGFSS